MLTFTIICVVLSIILWLASDPKKGDYHSRWSYRIPNFNYSTDEFYEQLAIGIDAQKIDGCYHKVVLEKEGGMLSASRKYFKVTWKEYEFFMCAAPFGNGFFLSWWLFVQPRSGNKIRIPIIGSILNAGVEDVTMYQLDTAEMFMGYCHDVMLAKVKNITKDTGITLSEASTKPILKDIFKRDK